MKNTAVIYALCALFALTVVVGLLSPEEARDALERSLESETEELVVEEPMAEHTQGTTSKEATVEISSTLYPVLRVIDGDTIVITVDGVSETVRLLGVDTPETVHPTKSVECFGLEASARTKEWLEGRRVELMADATQGERDKYFRLLAYVFRDDGFFVNLELVRQGYAYEYTYNLPYQYQWEFQQAEDEARIKERGLWGAAADCTVSFESLLRRA